MPPAWTIALVRPASISSSSITEPRTFRAAGSRSGRTRESSRTASELQPAAAIALHPGGDREDQGVEHDVRRIQAVLLDRALQTATGDGDLHPWSAPSRTSSSSIEPMTRPAP